MHFTTLSGIVLASLITATAAFSKEMPKQNMVSSAVIRTEGLKIDIPGKGVVRIVDILPKGEAKLDCMVHVPSVSKVIGANFERLQGMGAVGTVEIQVNVTPDGKLLCSGSGNGFTIKVEM